MRARRFAAVAIAALLAAPPAFAAALPRLAADLSVRIDRLPEAGTLRVTLHDEATFSGSGIGLMSRTATSRGGEGSVAFDRLPPGAYAVTAFLDRNGNARRDAGEPQAATTGTGQTGFEAAAIVLAPGANQAVIHLTP